MFQQLHKSFATLVAAAALSLLFGVQPALAQKVVLMPMADLSKGGDGVNFAFTKAVETALKQLEVELAPRSDVKLFMARNKIRTYHYLDSYLVKKLGVEFNSSLVLVGTVTEQDRNDKSIGMTFTAYDTADGNPVWSTTRSTSVAEQVRAFGVGEPKSSTELARPLLKEMLAPVAEIARTTEISERRDYQLLGMYLFPAYVQGGQAIDANLKIRFLGKRPTLIAAESAAGKSYLQYDRRTDSYQGKWFAPQDDGNYKVDLRMEWGREQTVEKVEAVAAFDVINSPPGLLMEIKKGIQVGQRLAMKDHVLILPRIGDTRPLAGWALEIKTETGESLVFEEYEGDIPERMVWEGRSSDGFRMANGNYAISLHVWDLAGNKSSDTRTLALQSSAPQVTADISLADEKALLRLATEGRFEFPITSWTAEVRSLDGKSLAKKQGTELPDQLEFRPAEGDEFVFLTVNGEDLLGNRLRIKRQKLAVVPVENETETKKAESWVPDF